MKLYGLNENIERPTLERISSLVDYIPEKDDAFILDDLCPLVTVNEARTFTIDEVKEAAGKKRVFLVHGWEGNPGRGWFPWLKQKLEGMHVTVMAPAMPNPDEPHIDAWIPYLRETVGEVDQNTFFVGHSIGCQAILRFLVEQENKAGGMVLVAPWFVLDEEDEIIDEWSIPLDFDAIGTPEVPVIAIFSEDDPDVSHEDNVPYFEDRLDADVVLVDDEYGHFADDITELPVVFQELLRLL